jgi:hypothetical protein
MLGHYVITQKTNVTPDGFEIGFWGGSHNVYAGCILVANLVIIH